MLDQKKTFIFVGLWVLYNVGVKHGLVPDVPAMNEALIGGIIMSLKAGWNRIENNLPQRSRFPLPPAQ